MGFVVRKDSCRRWPVTVRIHVGDAAGVVTPVESTFVGHFKSFTEAEHAAIVAKVDESFPPPAEGALPRERILARNADYLGRLLVGWDGVASEDDAPLLYSREALAALVCGPDGFAISDAFFTAIAEIRSGVAPLKNSPPSVAPGDSSSAAGGAIPPTAPT